MPELRMLLYVSGAFSLVLGAVHFFLPILLDFRTAIPLEGAALKPLRLGVFRYATTRRDVVGIAWIMNHAASYVLVTLGLLDLFWTRWLDTPLGILLSLWIAGWWLVRAASQLYLGKRSGDWLILAWFAALGLLHIAVVL